MSNVFEAVRTIPAWEAAQKAGLPLKKHGARHWTSCPLHQDKTPSLMLDEKGRWHCFSCGAGGDAAALYGAVFRLAPLEAARRLCADFGLRPQGNASGEVWQKGHGPPAVTALDLKRAAEAHREKEAAGLLKVKFAARDEAQLLAGKASSPDAAWDNPAFVLALALMDAANIMVYNLDGATPSQLTEALAEQNAQKGENGK